MFILINYLMQTKKVTFLLFITMFYQIGEELRCRSTCPWQSILELVASAMKNNYTSSELRPTATLGWLVIFYAFKLDLQFLSAVCFFGSGARVVHFSWARLSVRLWCQNQLLVFFFTDSLQQLPDLTSHSTLRLKHQHCALPTKGGLKYIIGAIISLAWIAHRNYHPHFWLLHFLFSTFPHIFKAIDQEEHILLEQLGDWTEWFKESSEFTAVKRLQKLRAITTF